MVIPVDVCIITFRRPLQLSRLLHSLLAQQLDGIVMRIIVVDNDASRSARPALDAHGPIAVAAAMQRVLYDVEPQQSIALARNRAMAHVRADYFAFVDDDQTVSQTWLASLLAAMLRLHCDVVFGPVESTLPPNAPAWASRCFRRPQRLTGELMQHGGAGNVMIRRKILGTMAFDPAYGLTGGEDTDFFYRMHCAGRYMVWCAEATATEPVPAMRLTLAWVRRRGFRDGQTYARIFVQPRAPWQKVGWLLRKLVHLIGGILIAPVLRCVSYPRYVALTVRLAAASGQLAVLFSEGYVEEYRVPASR